MSDLILNDANFDQEVTKSDLPVLVDFFAEWCGPCKMMAPVIEEIAKEYAGKLKVGKLDVDLSQQSSMKFGFMSIPTVALFKGGQIVSTLIGFRPKETLVAEINRYV